MKNLLLILITASVFTACKSSNDKSQEAKTDIAPINTAGYRMSDASTDISKYQEGEDEVEVPVTTKSKKSTNTVVYRTVYVPAPAPAPVYNHTPSSAPATQPDVIPTSTGGGSTASTGNDNSSTVGTGSETATTKKKGWSDAAKGAVIGGAAGAIGGAVINGKNRGKGAIIGAVIGAAGGYVIGRKRDKNKQEANPFGMLVNN